MKINEAILTADVLHAAHDADMDIDQLLHSALLHFRSETHNLP